MVLFTVSTCNMLLIYSPDINTSFFLFVFLLFCRSVIMHHYIQKDASTCAAKDHPVQTIHLHNGPEQHRVSPGRIHGWRLQPAGRHQLPAGPLQLHGEHRQHESPDGGHRGSQRSGTRPRQPTRHQQHHHHHRHGNHLCLGRQQGAERSAQKVPLHWDSGVKKAKLPVTSENKTWLPCWQILPSS